MSVLSRLGIRSAPLSTVEAGLFFTVVTGAYFGVLTLPFLLVLALLRWMQWGAVLDPSRWLGAMPAWLYALEVAGYLLLVTLYWEPGDEKQNESELRGFVLFLLLAAAAGTIWLEVRYGSVSWLVRTVIQETAG